MASKQSRKVSTNDRCLNGNSTTETNVMEEDDEIEGGIRIGDIYVPPPPPPALTYDNTGPRLIISHIENVNFKSYAGTQILGPFHKNFTAIVGPNGSGKSNVIDSMLFVFGYRAQKIRSKKISVLIHNSKKHPNIQSCTVTVHFQKIIDHEDGSFEPVPDSQIQVSRTANRDNSSSYFLNERKVSFKEVAKLLRSNGIDLDHNRFLILQGEVELIAMMKPKAQGEHDSGMLEFIEDIIGCNRFKVPIEKLDKEVEELNELRGEKINRIKAVEKEKSDLEGPMNDAIKYLLDENEIVLMRNAYYQKEVINKKETKVKAEVAFDAVKLELEEINKKLTELRTEGAEREKEQATLVKESQACEKLCQKKKEEFEEMERKDLAIRESYKHNKGKLKKLKQNMESEKEKLSVLRELPSSQESKIKELNELKARLDADLAKGEENLSEAMKTLKDETKTLQEEKDIYESELIGLKKVVDETRSRNNVLQAELEVYLSSEIKEKNKLEEMQRQAQNLEGNFTEKEQILQNINRDLPKFEDDLKTCEAEFAELGQREQKINEQVRVQRSRMEDARTRMQATRSQNKVQTALYDQKDTGKIKGILGRLGDLGGIDAKYDIAISTACGSLDHFVANTIDTAQQCVQFLKEKQVGQCSFIALDKMTRMIPQMQRPFQAPENIPRLFDLVKVENEHVLPAFYFALKDTLVANDLDQATRIGLQGSKRYRVVTLKGELVDISGTMSGGGNRVISGRMGPTVTVGRPQAHGASDSSRGDVSVLENQVKEGADELVLLREQKNQREDKMRQLGRDIVALRLNKQKVMENLVRIREQKATLSAQIEEQKEQVASVVPDQAKVKEMKKRLDKAEKEFKKATDEASKVEVKVQRMNDQIKEVTGKKLESVQNKVKDLKKKIDEILKEITKSSVSAKTAIRNAAKAEEKIENCEKELVETEDAIRTALSELDKMNVEAVEVNKNFKDAEEKRQRLLKDATNLSKAVKELKNKEKKLLEDNIDITTAYDKAKGQLSDITRSLSTTENKLLKLTLNHIEMDKDPPTLPKLIDDELKGVDLEKLGFDIQLADETHKKKKPNMAAIVEFKKKEALYLMRVKELEAVTADRDLKRSHCDQFRKERLTEFLDGFRIITNKLKEVYQMLTLGGDAELELVDSLDPFSEGIVFSVRPPKKSWKNISNLSGGEKTLSSLGLVMALHYYRPTPLYVMDEIDAALDFRNVSIVGHYIKERTKNAQFIVISLRNDMFELADRLVGIYKTYDCTQSVTINPSSFEMPINPVPEVDAQKGKAINVQ